MESGNATPDLQSILATLAQYAPPIAPSVTEAAQHGGSSTPPATQDHSSSSPVISGFLAAGDVRHEGQSTHPRPHGQAAGATPKSMIDPATITTWQDGLRCVTKIAASNAQFATSIKRMMKDQAANERRWYTERQNLKITQANRSSSAAKALSILKSLNTSFAAEPRPDCQPDVDKDAELAAFDLKIHSAQSAMEASMTAELKSLGVPFFGTDAKLVVSDGPDLLKESVAEGQPRWSPLVTESQLMELRRKMVGHLEDLYRD